MNMIRIATVSLLPLIFATLPAGAAGPQATETAAKLTIEKIVVEPEKPKADTLCKLRVVLRNAGEQKAYAFGFQVTINGQEIPAYKKLLYMTSADANSDKELQLFNFWSTETHRPMPSDNKLNIEVTLKEAQWVESTTNEEGTIVWKPLGKVEGLPVSKTIVVAFAE